MSAPDTGLEIAIQIQCPSVSVPGERDFHGWVAAALQEKHCAREITIRVVDEAESRTLNKRYRGRDAPTNVLSFPADLPAAVDHPLLGDLVICAPLLESEAREQGKDLQAHWAHLVVHGVLHLLGHDHQQTGEAEIMEAREVEILASLGFPGPVEQTNGA